MVVHARTVCIALYTSEDFSNFSLSVSNFSFAVLMVLSTYCTDFEFPEVTEIFFSKLVWIAFENIVLLFPLTYTLIFFVGVFPTIICGSIFISPFLFHNIRGVMINESPCATFNGLTSKYSSLLTDALCTRSLILCHSNSSSV